MHAPLLSRDVAVRRPGADHPAADFAVRGASDMARADIRIRASANGDRMAADSLARSSSRLNPLGARFRLCAPSQRQHTKDQQKSHRILHLSFAALRREGHPTEGLSTIVTLLGLRFPPGKDERMFLYPEVGIEALTSRERGAPLRLGLKRNTFLVLFLRNKGLWKRGAN
jgi:hypothetical protein